jgi:hypothetical protein
MPMGTMGNLLHFSSSVVLFAETLLQGRAAVRSDETSRGHGTRVQRLQKVVYMLLPQASYQKRDVAAG